MEIIDTKEWLEVEHMVNHFMCSMEVSGTPLENKIKFNIVDHDGDVIKGAVAVKYLSGEIAFFTENEHFKITKGDIFDWVFDHRKPALSEGN